LTVRVAVRVIPRAPKNEVGGVRDGRMLVRVTAPPVDSAANDAVVAVLAAHFGTPRRAVRIVSGERSRNKIVEIEGVVPPGSTARV
jgi:uncharacterized protein (TIGR00251 family)